METGGFLQSAEDAGNVVVGVFNGKPVYLREVAEIMDGAEEPSQYVFFGRGTRRSAAEEPAVTLTVAKRPGANAISVANDVLRRVETLGRDSVGRRGVRDAELRRNGRGKVQRASFSHGHCRDRVSLLILFLLGWRESLIVAIAIPSTLALTLLVFYLLGFTLNRITLFALIFSIGILVDDAIVVVENIVRHFHFRTTVDEGRSSRLRQSAKLAIRPFLLPLRSFLVLPMAFVGGLMGPYMRPIPIGASAAMFFSLAIAFIVTLGGPRAPLAPRERRLLAHAAAPGGSGPHSRIEHEEVFTRLYRRIMGPLIGHREHAESSSLPFADFSLPQWARWPSAG